jgi:hypothetical protein
MGKFVQMNASPSKSTLKFLVYRASVASLAAPLRTPEPTPRPLRDQITPILFRATLEPFFWNFFARYTTGLELGTYLLIMNYHPSTKTTTPYMMQTISNMLYLTHQYRKSDYEETIQLTNLATHV